MLSANEISQMLELMEYPAFCVADGAILCANRGAVNRRITPGTPIAQLLGQCRSDYEEFESGSLYLTIQVEGIRYGASLRKIGCLDVFTLEAENQDSALRAYALAAKTFRKPLHEVMTITSGLTAQPGEDDKLARLQRALYQMLRLVGNMSMPSSMTATPEMRDVTAVMQELFDRAQVLCESAGVPLHFENLPVSVYSMIDSTLLEKCVYAILSNSLKYAQPSCTISASLTRRRNTLYLTICDTGHLDEDVKHSIFDRFHREPSIEDGRHGLGLGLKLARSVALAHEGSLWVDEPRDGGVRVMLSLPIQQGAGLRQRVQLIDLADDWDAGLIELAEVLPPEWYKK